MKSIKRHLPKNELIYSFKYITKYKNELIYSFKYIHNYQKYIEINYKYHKKRIYQRMI